MRIDRVYIDDYKNLKHFTIDLDEKEMKTVLLGPNASGKSNFIEALILIFKYLDLSTESKRQSTSFDYNIIYKIQNNTINVTCQKGNYVILVNDEKQTFKSFFSNEAKAKYQPKYVFTYYSGLSNKLKELFWDHQNNFYNKIIGEDFKDTELDSLRKLFYVQLVHSYFVLLAYFTHEEEESLKFLNEVLNIEDIESILFILKMPKWAESRIRHNPDDIFWTAKGLVRPFLEKLWELSLAPIYNDEKIRTDFAEIDDQKRLYLYLKGKDKLQKLAKIYTSNTALFKALESTYISKLIAEVRIKVQKKNVDGSITFKELSEGEQQLLTVLGLLKFTKDEDSLILLDEPDTHLNPIWKWRYLEFLDKVVDRPASTQIILNTHDPLVIGNLRKEEVRLFRSTDDGKITVEQPEIDPRGLGVEGILTSEFFGLPTTIDEFTKGKLDERNELLVRQQKQPLSEQEQETLRKLFTELEDLGFGNTFRDPLYQKFIVAYKNRIKEHGKNSFTKDELDKQNALAMEILEELSKEEENDSH
ncbi:AAA family ATPase [Chryseobacterium viscerum]|uniref:AAA family ATPase n=1 Tax=Chryseobacterium viscerum TaxID=1037377 RepID=A0A5N4BSL3_9FLAO|nr:AAA family ATPase [Chryseobacterium viscerum]KAB1231418.1 AAA family ATPase [Chryseobacterium viscerum]